MQQQFEARQALTKSQKRQVRMAACCTHAAGACRRAHACSTCNAARCMLKVQAALSTQPACLARRGATCFTRDCRRCCAGCWLPPALSSFSAASSLRASALAWRAVRRCCRGCSHLWRPAPPPACARCAVRSGRACVLAIAALLRIAREARWLRLAELLLSLDAVLMLLRATARACVPFAVHYCRVCCRWRLLSLTAAASACWSTCWASRWARCAQRWRASRATSGALAAGAGAGAVMVHVVRVRCLQRGWAERHAGLHRSPNCTAAGAPDCTAAAALLCAAGCRVGDVKYHLGQSGTVRVGPERTPVHVSIAPNPSHLEVRGHALA